MAKKPRINFIPFGEQGVVNDFEQFGARAEGAANYTKNIALIQALEAWNNGWRDALLSGNRAPFLEDMNALFLVIGYMTAYQFQEGVPEWDASTVYYIGSIVKREGTFEFYGSKIDDNEGNALPTARTSDTNWEFLGEKTNGYRRPVLEYSGASTVDVEAQTGVANTTSILFPDGTLRTVTEDLSSTDKYRRLNITVNANWTSGTEESGLRPGLSEGTNRWYAVYAVKSQIDATKFVLVGDDTPPVAANFGTLNTRYGANSWLYLGSIRNGDNISATGDIIPFQMAGYRTMFTNIIGNLVGLWVGVSSGGASPWVWGASAGMVGDVRPPNVKFGDVLVRDLHAVGVTTQFGVAPNTGASQYYSGWNMTQGSLNGNAMTSRMPLTNSVVVWFNGTASIAVALVGFEDAVLMAGINNPI